MRILLVGLGNIGKEYAATRHNAGFWFVDNIAEHYGTTLVNNKKFLGAHGKFVLNGTEVHLLQPHTLMNLSGQSVAAFAKFFAIDANKILVAHDELDIACGAIKLKTGGGHGGHNGLRDIIAKGIAPDFHRLRIGIGRPAHGGQGAVSSFVLGCASTDERLTIGRALDFALAQLPELAAAITSDNIGKNIDKVRSAINGFAS